MGRSQGKRIAQKKTVSRAKRNIAQARIILLLDDKSYRLRGMGGAKAAIFESPEMLIDLLKAKDVDQFWEEVSKQNLEMLSTNAQGLRRLFKDPVFRQFYNQSLDAAKRDMKSFPRPESHWIASFDFEDQANADLFQEEFGKLFLEGLSDPNKRFRDTDGFILQSDVIGQYDVSNYFSTKIDNVRSTYGSEKFYDFLFKEIVPNVKGDVDAYTLRSLRSSVTSAIADIETSEDKIEDPEEAHNRLKELLGPETKLGGRGYYYAAPWTRRGVSVQASETVGKIWKDKGTLKKEDVDELGKRVCYDAFSKQLATVLTRDYREKTIRRAHPEKIREGMAKVKNKKTIFRRLKPIFENEGMAKEFNSIVKNEKLNSISDSELILLVEAVSKDFVDSYTPSDPNFDPKSVSLSKIFVEKIKAL